MENCQKGLKKFLIDCFTKLGEKLDIQFPPCGCSSDEDVTPPGLVPKQRRTEGASTSNPPAHLDEMIPHRPGKEHAAGEEDSDEGIEDYVPETDED